MKEWICPLTGVVHYFQQEKHKEKYLSEKEIRQQMIQKLEDLKAQMVLSNPELALKEEYQKAFESACFNTASNEEDLAYFKNKLLQPLNFDSVLTEHRRLVAREKMLLMEDAMCIYHLVREAPKPKTTPQVTEVDDVEKFVGPLDAIGEVERLAPEHYQHVKDILESMGFIQSVPLNDKWMIHLKRAIMPTWKITDVETLRPMEVNEVTVEFAIKVHLADLFLKGDEWRVISDGEWHEARFIDGDEEAFEVML